MISDFTEPALIDGITRLVSKAAAEIMRIKARPLAARIKEDDSPVTEADEVSEAVIAGGLSRLLPGIPVISEEAAAGREAGAPGSAFLLVDPLDGTREFIAGRDEFTVNVAIIENGRAVAGIIAAPARGMVWRGATGRGAEILTVPAGADPAAARPQRIAARPFAEPPLALVSRSHSDAESEAFLSRWPHAKKESLGSALKFALLAEGKADIYPRLAPTCEWDIAAGDAILSAAGGILLGHDGGLILYGNAATNFRVPTFIAWGDPGMARRNAV